MVEGTAAGGHLEQRLHGEHVPPHGGEVQRGRAEVRDGGGAGAQVAHQLHQHLHTTVIARKRSVYVTQLQPLLLSGDDPSLAVTELVKPRSSTAYRPRNFQP